MPLEVIIFDLDNTLYHANTGLVQEIGRRIRLWLQRTLDISNDQAGDIQRDYYERYGTTMGGLVIEHQDLDIADYLRFVHDIAIDTYLDPDPRLAAMLESIPLRKAVYTNATSEYGKRVLQALGIDTYFEHVIGIEEVNLRNKVYRDAYERMLQLIEARPGDCAMVEDWVSNLRAAKELGMITILIGTEEVKHVDFTIDSVLKVKQVVQDILAAENRAQKSSARSITAVADGSRARH